ncbi:MAG: Mg-dependent DNase [Cytophagales bacterium]|nr:MAG: Mg-dependent DNase [Cytophagales bacterium]
MKLSPMNFWDFHTHQKGKANAIFNGDDEVSPAGLFCSLGIHPWDLDENWEVKWLKISSQVKESPSVLAIGECGFDRLKGPELEIQKAAFHAQASLAFELGIPLILHCVKGHDLLLEYLKKEKNIPQIIWHGWNLKPDLALRLLDFPVFFSFGHHLKKEESNAQAWLKACPPHRIFFETDDSNMEISEIYQAASLILGLSPAELAQQGISNWNQISSRKIQ